VLAGFLKLALGLTPIAARAFPLRAKHPVEKPFGSMHSPVIVGNVRKSVKRPNLADYRLE
jgi:hypothetical protein